MSGDTEIVTIPKGLHATEHQTGGIDVLDLNLSSFENLAINGDFEFGDPPIGWTVWRTTAAQEGTIVKIGSYAAKITANTGAGQPLGNFSQTITTTRYQGRKVTIGAWIRIASGNSGDVKLRLDDSVSYDASAALAKDDTYHWITLTRDIAAAATFIRPTVLLECGENNNTDVAYIDGFIVVEGEMCPAFSPNPADVATKELYVPVTYKNPNLSTTGDFPVALLAIVGDTCFTSFEIPHDFNGLVAARLIVIPKATQAAANWDIDSDYGSIGQAYNIHSEADAASTYNVTLDELFEVNLNGILSAIVAGDKVGIKVTLQDNAHDVHVIGIRLRYI